MLNDFMLVNLPDMAGRGQCVPGGDVIEHGCQAARLASASAAR